MGLSRKPELNAAAAGTQWHGAPSRRLVAPHCGKLAASSMRLVAHLSLNFKLGSNPPGHWHVTRPLVCSQNGSPSEIGGALLACTRSGPGADSQHPRHVLGGLGASLCGQLLVAQSTPKLLFSISMNVHMNLSAHGLRLEAQAEADLSLMVAAIQQAAIVGVVRH